MCERESWKLKKKTISSLYSVEEKYANDTRGQPLFAATWTAQGFT